MTKNRTRRLAILGVAILLALVVGGLLAMHTGFLPVPTGEHEQRTVQISDCDGTAHGTVTVDVADSFSQRYVGLSRTDSLAPNEGMLLVYGSEDSREIGMRNMDFGLDVLFIGSDGRVTDITTLDAPDSTVEYYLTYDSATGVAQYVLEVDAGWADANGVSPGDCVSGLP